MKAVKAEEIVIRSENKIGLLSDISKIISFAGVNVRAVSAWAVEGDAFFRLITSDCKKTKDILSGSGYSFQEKEVVIVELSDEVGSLTDLTSKLKDSGIDLEYVYGTTSKPKYEAIIVFSSTDNQKAMEVLSP